MSAVTRPAKRLRRDLTDPTLGGASDDSDYESEYRERFMGANEEERDRERQWLDEWRRLQNVGRRADGKPQVGSGAAVVGKTPRGHKVKPDPPKSP